ncbi:MAG TPA: hypothetical protein VF456_25905 [Vicinamibacterales bacterium]
MQRKLYLVIGVSAVVAVAGACGRPEASPVSPAILKPIVSSNEVAGVNGATLKVTSPTLVSPTDQTVVADAEPMLVWQPVSLTSGSGDASLAYDWEVYDAAGTKVRTEVVRATSWAAQGLNYEQRYTWRVRATASYVGNDGKVVDAFGPWSDTQSFITPVPPPRVPPPGSVPAGASCSSLTDPFKIVACRRAQFGAHMTPDQVVVFLKNVAFDLNKSAIGGGPYGLLRKRAGQICGDYSCDIICSGSGAGQKQWDMLLDSDGAQTPVWSGPHTPPNIRVDACDVP